MLKIKNLSNTTKGARSLVHIYILSFTFFFFFSPDSILHFNCCYLGVFGENFEETRN